MLHLLPLRAALRLLIILVAVGVALMFGAGILSDKEIFKAATQLVRWSTLIVTGSTLLCYAGWRWIPIIQRWIFPYLGGDWEGTLVYSRGTSEATVPIQLLVKHTLFGIRLLLDSAESTSQTLVVHAEKDPDFDRYKLYYVYLNQRKEGVQGAGDRYRGLAVLRVDNDGLLLQGDYFTENHRRGTLSLAYKKPTAWWKIWR
ncbi:hypothetical protein AB0305_04000 [Arthrobacter sp. NPDC080086]|uniref:Cap15 family cyclic dinucleotide receptor domain-containing protein n=1 Tax=Arthrobacter sp. NPDC080086 TaxID=3155917 RepID=UPI00344B6A85